MLKHADTQQEHQGYYIQMWPRTVLGPSSDMKGTLHNTSTLHQWRENYSEDSMQLPMLQGNKIKIKLPHNLLTLCNASVNVQLQTRFLLCKDWKTHVDAYAHSGFVIVSVNISNQAFA